MTPIHFGPVYTPHPPSGESLALCRPGAVSATLAGDQRMVTCSKCLRLMPLWNRGYGDVPYALRKS